MPDTKSFGDRLKSAREARGVTLSQAAQTLRLKEKYLGALEEGRYHEIAHETYAAGCARAYAKWLGVEGETPTHSASSSIMHSAVVKNVNQTVAEQHKLWAFMFLFRWPKTGLAGFSCILAIAAYLTWYGIHKISTPELPEPMLGITAP